MIDARDRVLGRIERVADVRLPGMLYAALVRSRTPRGVINFVDARAALAMPGVQRLITLEDLVDEGLADVRFGTIVRDQPLLAGPLIRHFGEPLLVVLAGDPATATKAARLVRVEVETEPPVLEAEKALEPAAARIHAERPDNVLTRWGFEVGDLKGARASAAHHFTGRWTSPAAQVVSLETHAVSATWPSPDALEIWSTTQAPSRTAMELARVFQLDPQRVSLRVPPLGGAFGGKNHAKLEPLIAAASRIAGRPVLYVNRRDEEFVTITKHAMTVEIASGVDAEGRFVYRSARIVADGGAYANSSPVIPKAAGGAVLGPYRVPAASVTAAAVYTNQPPAGSFRGLGVSQVAWASEQQVDEIAHRLGMDPIAFRRANLVRDGDRLPNGDQIRGAHWLDCLNAVVARSPADDADAPASDDPAWIRRGRGVAVVLKATMAPSRTDVRLELDQAGTLTVFSSAVDMGQGTRTAIARMAATALGHPLDRVRVAELDTAVTPFDATTSSSRTIAQHHHAIAAAAKQLRLEFDLIATRHDDGSRAPSAGLPVGAGVDRISAEGSYTNEPAVDALSGRPEQTTEWHQGAVAVEVAVDVETGHVSIERMRGAAWAGRVVDPVGALRQNEGNLIFGLGPTMSESLQRGLVGPLPTSLRDYRIPGIRDVPEALETVSLEREDAEGTSPSGLGESLVTAVSPAVANALFRATGIRSAELPLSPDLVLSGWDALVPTDEGS